MAGQCPPKADSQELELLVHFKGHCADMLLFQVITCNMLYLNNILEIK